MTNSVHEQRQALGQRLREIRKDAGLTGRQLAALAGWHESLVSKIETGNRTPTEAQLHAYCTHTGTESQLPDLVATVRNIESAYLEFKRLLHAGTKRRQQQSVTLAEQTKVMRIYEPVLIPGMLQTADYAAAVLRRVTEFYRVPNDVDQGVSKRLEQQKVLYHGDHRFHILITEQSLATTVGNDGVMAGQLDRLLAVIGLPRMLFGIVPAGAEWLTPATNFVMFDDRMVMVEAITAELTITQPREIALYARAFETLARQAVTGEDARRLIRAEIDRRSHKP
ncbi:helix-turn-helix domain-containing protein [Nocardia cyriacigeorgica]|uniref:Helix-turn-helix domain-containing protein n=2 Tax=Nocardia cyriacigeorgica TaxID=135487 RepID=A0A5R8NZM8_9NOCA|nr:helix-turn-helix transcriptional regulator [Nocardia cyriacigeorgica]TLF82326.1 helix-turn-helix domain-containing protein [Nocardia cyriacigeorgica]CCF61779.1 putative DNA-binding protein [Nocardia cyriacigeorgica GUH-2]